MIQIPANNPGTLTGPGNNTYLLDGAEPTLIDAGVGHASHIDAIAAHLGGRALVRVLVTHGHPDHASGVPALRTRWPGIEACKWLADPEPGWRPLRDNERVRAGDTWLSVVHTPGHAPDHVCFWQSDTREVLRRHDDRHHHHHGAAGRGRRQPARASTRCGGSLNCSPRRRGRDTAQLSPGPLSASTSIWLTALNASARLWRASMRASPTSTRS
ncbi:MAG: MBL fold metallo-hydrolase [Acidobacteria bacterium]|nr:MBL fold metallo-hydrolase [Acidobacteriota bacterium]